MPKKSKCCAKNVDELIKLRKRSWKKRGDITHDAKLVQAIAYQILENEHLRNEILQKPYL